MNNFKQTVLLIVSLAVPALLGTTTQNARAQSGGGSHRFSAAAGTASATAAAPTPGTAAAKTSASKTATDRLHDDWVAASLVVLEDLSWWLKVAGFIALWWGLSALLAIPLYRSGLPLSAFGAARWALFWGALICCLLPYPFTFFTSWYWLDYWFLGGLFGILMLVLLISALSQPAARRVA